MIKTKLLIKSYVLILALLGLFAASMYLVSVPLISNTVITLEENAARTALDSIYDRVENLSFSLETEKRSIIESRKRELNNVVQIAESFIKNIGQRVDAGLLSREEARRQIINELRSFKYGNSDYLWLADYRSFMLSHPDPKLHGTDCSRLKDHHGSLIVLPMVEMAKKEGDGYHSYWWRRLGEEKPIEKLSYVKRMPEWGWVIGTGVYVDDIEEEAERRKELEIFALRHTVNNLKIARSGYFYVFDASYNMIIHPNKELSGKQAGTLLNPNTGKPLLAELAAVAQQPDNKLYYRWDRPDDVGNYSYDKISWVRYNKNLDWYIAASVYVDELRTTSGMLKNRIITLSLALALVALLVGYVCVRKLMTPIERLSETALQVKQGNLAARCVVEGNDEISELAHSFNMMVEQQQQYIERLDDKVRERTAELEMAYLQLKELDAMKSSFLSTVSHELRTPLASILGFARIIKKKLDSGIFSGIDAEDTRKLKIVGQVSEALDIISLEGDRLTKLINDLLDLAKLEAGKVEWQHDLLSVPEIIERALAATSVLFAQKDIVLETSLEQDLMTIRGDRDRLIQVIINLIANAVKFTEHGTITVEARMVKMLAQDARFRDDELSDRYVDYVMVSVIDTGIGIAAEDIETVFEKFRQVGDILTEKPGGSGLGLSICKQIVEYHGGRIWSESAPGHGSVFSFTLPAEKMA